MSASVLPPGSPSPGPPPITLHSLVVGDVKFPVVRVTEAAGAFPKGDWAFIAGCTPSLELSNLAAWRRLPQCPGPGAIISVPSLELRRLHSTFWRISVACAAFSPVGLSFVLGKVTRFKACSLLPFSHPSQFPDLQVFVNPALPALKQVKPTALHVVPGILTHAIVLQMGTSFLLHYSNTSFAGASKLPSCSLP